MNPFAVTLDDSEDKNQAALFRWLSMASAWGLVAANDPRSYDEPGYAKTIGIPPSPEIRDQLSLVHAIPNGLALIDRRAGGAAKAIGLKPGIPDVFVPVPMCGYHGYYLELKTPKGSLEKSQKIVIPLLQAQGFLVEISIGWAQSATKIVNYLQGRKT